MSEEAVDIKPELEEKCRPQCVKHWLAYEVGRPARGALAHC